MCCSLLLQKPAPFLPQIASVRKRDLVLRLGPVSETSRFAPETVGWPKASFLCPQDTRVKGESRFVPATCSLGARHYRLAQGKGEGASNRWFPVNSGGHPGGMMSGRGCQKLEAEKVPPSPYGVGFQPRNGA